MGFFSTLFLGDTKTLEKCYDPDKGDYMYWELKEISQMLYVKYRSDLNRGCLVFSACTYDGEPLSNNQLDIIAGIASRDFGKKKPTRNEARVLASHLVAVAAYAIVNTLSESAYFEVEEIAPKDISGAKNGVSVWDFLNGFGDIDDILRKFYPKRIKHYYYQGNGLMNSNMWGSI